MATICFVSYEIHPTTWGGCGVLLRHAAEHLLRRGHEIVFLLDVPREYFDRFDGTDRLTFSHAERCRAYHVDTLCKDFPLRREEVPRFALWKSLRFAHAHAKLAARERLDFVEFFEYCGVGYYALVRRLFGVDGGRAALGVRLHNSIELIDTFGATRLDEERASLYALERGTLRLAETILTPTTTYFERHYRDRYGIDPARVVVSQSPKMPFPRVERRPVSPPRVKIVHVGRLFGFKGVDQLVRAAVTLMRRRPDLDCTVELIGPDSEDTPLGASFVEFLRELMPEDLRPRFVFAGHLPHEAMAEHVADALFAVFPNRFESFCYALHEVYDAGVPVVINDLPGFADFFRHEENALVYDGTTEGLVAAMARLVDDAALRARLSRPHAVAEEPLGAIYDAPRAMAPLRAPPGSEAPTPGALVIVLVPRSGGAGLSGTLAALAGQRGAEARMVCLHEGETGDEESIHWLGARWRARDGAGLPIAASELVARDVLVILRAGDVPEPGWLARSCEALRQRPRLGFAGTWMRRAGAVVPTFVDLLPERYPFEQGAEPTRMALRTDPGRHLADVLDPNLGTLGEVGYLWSAVARWGAGCVLPEPLIAVTEPIRAPVEPSALHYLLLRYGAPFAEQLGVLAGQLGHRLRVLEMGSGVPHEECAYELPLATKLNVAQGLDGRTLLRLALEKLGRKLGRRPAQVG